MDEEPKSLKQVFAQAETRRQALEGVYDASSSKYRDDLNEALQGYQKCLELISKLGIFSPNESAEDISTPDLPYLLIDYWIAELLEKSSAPSPAERRHVLDAARDTYERFLHQLDSYSLLTPPYTKLLQSYTDEPLAFSTVSTTDATARRNAKLVNYRAEKELRQKLDYLQQRRRRHGQDLTDNESSRNGNDDEAARDVYLADVAYRAHQAFQALEGLNRELEVLAQAPTPLLPQTTSVEEDERRRADEQAADGGSSSRLDQPLRRLQSLDNNGGPLLTAQGKPLQPFTLLTSRQELQKGVFRPGHNLPTMTIDEYLDEERRRGGIIEGGGEASYRREEPDEDDMEKADAETMKARAWDEFTEANPRGAGNTLNRG